jgi:hypothetical protein
MHAVTIRIPDNIDFAHLKLARHLDTGDIAFDWAPIEAICAASDIDPDHFKRSAEDNVVSLIVAWYRRHVAAGGAPDLVAEQLGAEVAAESVAGVAAVQQAPARLQ